eukprot:g6648.t1
MQGSVETQLVHVDRELGALRMVHVEREQLSDKENDHSSWFLDKLLIEDSNGAKHCFPCMQWFGTSQCGSIQAPLERYLLPSSLNIGEMMMKKKKRKQVEIKASGMVIPHPQKVLQGIKAQSRNGRGLGGEDAFFYAFGKNGVFGMGVADGVYAWREKGIDSGRFAFFLMDQAYINVKMGYDDVFQGTLLCFFNHQCIFSVVMKTASRKVETEGVYGSSTCCLLTINLNQGRLNSANLGDSGFIVIGCRDYGADHQLVFRTPQQEHEFGRPYQLGHHQYASPPHEAMLYNFQIFPGDTIIMGTDGLFDNVFLPKIIDQVKASRKAGLSPQDLAGRLISMAHESSLDKRIDTPYSKGFTEAFNLSSSGGKPDDITVIVAYVL